VCCWGNFYDWAFSHGWGGSFVVRHFVSKWSEFVKGSWEVEGKRYCLSKIFIHTHMRDSGVFYRTQSGHKMNSILNAWWGDWAVSGSCSLALGCFHVFFHSKQMKIELATQQGPKQSRTILQFLTDDSAGFDCLENYGKKIFTARCLLGREGTCISVTSTAYEAACERRLRRSLLSLE
jgi:hypothetical protein